MSVSYTEWLSRHMQIDDVAMCGRRNDVDVPLAEARWENNLRTYRRWKIDDRHILFVMGDLVGIDEGNGIVIWCLPSEPDAAIPVEVRHAVIATREALQIWRLGGELPNEPPWVKHAL
jgi:hypothetical protein